MEKHHPFRDDEIDSFFRLGEVSKQINDNQYDLLEDLCYKNSCEKMVGVEIGSWVGLSTCIMGLVVKKFHGQLYTVDWYKPTPQQHALESMYKMGIDVKGIFQSNINKFGLGDTVIQYNESSEEASKRFADNSLDFLFIDGDHTLNGIQTDMRCWFPKVKKDRLIFGHDYIQVKEGLELMKLDVDEKNDIWWIKK